MVVDVSTVPRLAVYARAGRVVVFDTETTGGSACDEICQIAAAEYVRGVKARMLALYICPTCEMNPWAERVHGLSIEFLREHGVAPEEAMRQFFDFVGEDALLVAHNANFDLRMLRQECDKLGVDFVLDGIDLCDTLALARHLRPDLECHALSYLIDALGIDGVNSHDALDDTLACAGVFFKLMQC